MRPDAGPELKAAAKLAATPGSSLPIAPLGSGSAMATRRTRCAPLSLRPRSKTGRNWRTYKKLLGIATRTIYRRLEEERGDLPPGEAAAAAAEAEREDAPVAEAAGGSLPNWQPAVPGGRS